MGGQPIYADLAISTHYKFKITSSALAKIDKNWQKKPTKFFENSKLFILFKRLINKALGFRYQKGVDLG